MAACAALLHRANSCQTKPESTTLLFTRVFTLSNVDTSYFEGRNHPTNNGESSSCFLHPHSDCRIIFIYMAGARWHGRNLAVTSVLQ